jgi:hypothetical protein
MASTEKKTPSRAGKPLLPPDEQFWKRYSPRYELPLAGATSFFVHGMVVGILAVGGLAFLFRAGAEASRPPQMDVTLIEAGAGDFGSGGMPGSPGEPGQQEVGMEGAGAPLEGANTGNEPTDELPSVGSLELDLPSSVAAAESKDDLVKQFEQLRADADKRSKDPAPKSGSKGGILGGKGVVGGTGKSGAGKGGQGGTGGTGRAGGGGRKATDQEIKAWRWRFDLAGAPKVHADKLDRAGLIIAVPDPAEGKANPEKGPYFLIRDLKRRPISLEKIDLSKYQDSVKWYSQKADSVRDLAKEIKLPFVPEFVVLLLPKDREAKMAAEERRFALQNGTNPAIVRETVFDFRLQNGVYEPVAVSQK